MAAVALRPHIGTRKNSEESSNETDYELYDNQAAVARTSAGRGSRRDTYGVGEKANESQLRAGRREEIQHEFQQLATVGFTSLVMGTWEIMFTTNAAVLRNGGLAGFWWSMVLSYIGQLFLVLSFAEMSSMVPSAGWQARFTANCWNLAGVTNALISLSNKDYNTASRWQHALLAICTAVTVSAFNALAAGHLSLAEGFFALCHVFALVPILVSLWVLAPKHSAADVFTNFTGHGTPWSSMGLSVLTGQSTALFTVLGSEAVVHIAEELEKRTIVVPQCMLWSFWYNVPITFLSLLTYLFNLGSIAEIVGAKESPIIYVLEQTFGSPQATLGFGIVIALLLFMVTTSTMVATSRHLYAFGRDRAMLYSDWISRVHVRLQVPLNAILCTLLFTTVVVSMTFRSTVALRIYITLSTACLHGTYIIAVGSLVWKRLRKEELPSAAWSLGRCGLTINVTALLYACWAFFWSFWPTYKDVDSDNYNWTLLIFASFLGMALFTFWRGVKRKGRELQRMDSFELLSRET